MAETKAELKKAQESSSHVEEEPQQTKITEEGNADAAGDPTEEVTESEFIQAYNGLRSFFGDSLNGTEDSQLKDPFSSFETVVDATIKKDNHTGNSREFGYVCFDDKKVVKTGLGKEHKINGGTVEAKKYERRKIIVGGILTSTKDEVVRTYFEKFGKIDIFCRPWENSLRNCVISFEMDASNKKCEECEEHKIDGKEVMVKYLTTKKHSSQRSGNERNRYFGGPRYQDRRTYRNEDHK